MVTILITSSSWPMFLVCTAFGTGIVRRLGHGHIIGPLFCIMSKVLWSILLGYFRMYQFGYDPQCVGKGSR